MGVNRDGCTLGGIDMSSPFLVVVVVNAPSFVLTNLLGYVHVCVGDDVAVGSRPRSLGWPTWNSGGW